MSGFDTIVDSAGLIAPGQSLPPLPPAAACGAKPLPEHKEAARQIAFALAFDDTPKAAEAALACGAALRHVLTAREAFGLAIAALGAIEMEHLRDLLDIMFTDDDTPPFPNWGYLPEHVLEDADLWALDASPRLREAFALACLARMSPADRAALLRAFKGAGT